MKIVLKRGGALSLATLTLCFSGVAFADGTSDQATNEAAAAAQGVNDPGSSEKVFQPEYTHAHQFTFTDRTNQDRPELQPVESLQIPDAWQPVEQADSRNHPVRLFQLVSHDGSFKPIGGRAEPSVNGQGSQSVLDSPEYWILLLLGLVMLAIIAFGRRAETYRLHPVGRVD